MPDEPDDKRQEEPAPVRRAAPSSSPNATRLYQEPTEDDWRLLDEAEACHQFIERRIRFCLKRVRTHVTSGYTDPFQEGWKVTPEMVEDHRANARNIVAELRRIQAILRGAEDDRRFEERTLVRAIKDTSPENSHWLRSLVESRLWDAKIPQKIVNVDTLDGLVCAVYALAEVEMSPETYRKLQAKRAREHIQKAIAYQGGFQRPPGRRLTSAPRWLEPLFVAAMDADLVPGEPLGAGGWYQSLLKREILTKSKGKNGR